MMYKEMSSKDNNGDKDKPKIKRILRKTHDLNALFILENPSEKIIIWYFICFRLKNTKKIMERDECGTNKDKEIQRIHDTWERKERWSWLRITWW